MSPVRVVALGRTLPVRLTVADAGELLGLPRTTAHRKCETEAWPVVGPKGQRVVLTVPFLERLGIPWQPATTDDANE